MQLDSEIKEVTKDDLRDRNEEDVILQADADKAEDLIMKIETFIDENQDVESMDETTKNQKYGQLKEYWQEFSNHINNIGFIFKIDEREFKFLKKFILEKCEYTYQTVFMGTQLRSDFLLRAEETLKTEGKIYITCNESVLIHHLFETGNFTVKGLRGDANMYQNVLVGIGDVNKYYNELDIASKRAGEDINDWVSGLEKAEETSEETTEQA